MLRKKLLLHGYVADAEAVLDYLKALNYLDDVSYCENFLRWRKQQGWGPIKIAYALQALGVDTELIDQQIDTDNPDWLEVAQKLWRKQFKGKRAATYAERARQMRFLQNRGFTLAQINSVINCCQPD